MVWKKIVRPEPIEAYFCTPPDLWSKDQELLHKAWLIRRKAYAPYSHYQVGAAVRCVGGGEHVGCNVEICTLTEGVHAEQAAIVAAVVAAGPSSRVDAVAIVGAHERVFPPNPADDRDWPDLDEVDDLSWAGVPCGHCLQIINEFKIGPEARLIGYHSRGVVSVVRFADALPFAFDPKDIE
jgi:cytidine deaminase